MIATLLLALQVAAPTDTIRHWRGEVGSGADFHSTDERSTWTSARAGLSYRWARSMVKADFVRTERFDLVEQAVGVDAWFPAGRRTSLYVRAALSSHAKVVAESDIFVEGARAFAHGWEGIVRYRHLGYATGVANVATLGVGLWRQQWYLRLLGSVVPWEGSTGASVTFAARHYFDPRRPESTLDLFFDGGRQVVTLAPPLDPALRTTSTLGARWQHPLSRRAGASATLYRSTEEEAPDRIGVGLGGYLTW